jgi:hypothetical protein
VVVFAIIAFDSWFGFKIFLFDVDYFEIDDQQEDKTLKM